MSELKKDDGGVRLMCLVIGSLIGSTCTYFGLQEHARQAIQTRAIESGDAQYHPTTGKFMFNGELEENE